MDEFWDAYDEHFRKIEHSVLKRGDPIPDGMYHLVTDVVVKHQDGTFLLMQRDLSKHLGGFWELTAGGSAIQGEEPDICAVRELQEETGILACALQELGRTVCESRHTIYVEYLCDTDCRKDSVVLQKGETIGYRWVDRQTLVNEFGCSLASDRTLKLLLSREQKIETVPSEDKKMQ